MFIWEDMFLNIPKDHSYLFILRMVMHGYAVMHFSTMLYQYGIIWLIQVWHKTRRNDLYRDKEMRNEDRFSATTQVRGLLGWPPWRIMIRPKVSIWFQWLPCDPCHPMPSMQYHAILHTPLKAIRDRGPSRRYPDLSSVHIFLDQVPQRWSKLDASLLNKDNDGNLWCGGRCIYVSIYIYIYIHIYIYMIYI